MLYIMRFVRSVSRQNLSFQSISLNNCLISNWRNILRNYADKPKADNTSKQIVVKGTEDLRLRVRRVRPADEPRVLRFVREYSRLGWPGEEKKLGVNNHVVLSDYVTRTLAQGHSMLAEQQGAKVGWSRIRGVALCSATCPWDAAMLEKWARCIKCPKSKKLMLMTAHCLRAPGLHDKYKVHNIMQIILIVPPYTPKASEITQLLAKNSIHRGRDLGFSVLRLDVSDDSVAKVLDKLQLKREYEFNYKILPTAVKVHSEDKNSFPSVLKEKSITVYTAFTSADNFLTKLK